MSAGRQEGAVIVAEGSINPAIFTHTWLARHDLVDEDEARGATIHYMDPDLSRFDVAHFRVEARRDRVTVGSAKAMPTFMPVKDFLAGIFEVLYHTPIDTLTMTKAVHAELPEGGWDAIAAVLAPFEPWQEVLERPALRAIGVSDPLGDHAGAVEVTVEPSVHVPGGAYIVASERVEFEAPDGARDATHALDERWAPWMARADGIIAAIEALAR